MLDALYFIGGYAVHGYHSVPPYQASHGCARIPLWAAHGVFSRWEHRRHRLRALMPRVIIVGAGFGGIAAAIELRRHGITDVAILEKADGLGGTWFHNTYPGAACDVPSHFYSFSFAQRRDWVRLCPTAARHPRLPARGRRRAGPGGDHRDRHARQRVPLGRRGAALDGRDEPRRAHGRRA